MAQFTQREFLFLDDLMHMEEVEAIKFQAMADQLSDPQLKQLCQRMAQRHQQHLMTLLGHVNQAQGRPAAASLQASAQTGYQGGYQAPYAGGYQAGGYYGGASSPYPSAPTASGYQPPTAFQSQTGPQESGGYFQATQATSYGGGQSSTPAGGYGQAQSSPYPATGAYETKSRTQGPH